MKMHLETRFGKLAIEITGHGTPFVLLHSGGHDRHDFDAIVPTLAQRFQTIAIDLLGHGDSTQPESAIATPAICSAVEDAVVALGLAPAIVLGNSVGGMAALHLAAARPERVRSLVLVSPSGLVEQTWLTRTLCAIQGMAWVRRATGMAFARSYLGARNAHSNALLSRMAERRRDPVFIAMEAALWRSFGRPESDLSSRVSAITCPTALVWGRRDPVLRMRVEGARARRLLPRARWIEMDAAHVPFVETPDAFLAAIEPFVSERVSVTRRASA